MRLELTGYVQEISAVQHAPDAHPNWVPVCVELRDYAGNKIVLAETAGAGQSQGLLLAELHRRLLTQCCSGMHARHVKITVAVEVEATQ